MNDITSASGGITVIRVELTCFYCGHTCGEARVRTSGRPSYRELRAAFAERPTGTAPTWDAHGTPRCPRCRGKLFIDVS
jgi:hypothetical protein